MAITTFGRTAVHAAAWLNIKSVGTYVRLNPFCEGLTIGIYKLCLIRGNGKKNILQNVLVSQVAGITHAILGDSRETWGRGRRVVKFLNCTLPH